MNISQPTQLSCHATRWIAPPSELPEAVELLRYLIRTFGHPGEVVLDITLGAFSTAIACQLEERKFIGFEQNEKHFNQGVQRLRNLIAAAARDC